MNRKHTKIEKKEYFEMTDRISQHWLKLFDDDNEFYSTVYWDLLTRIWRSKKPVTKPQAIKFIAGVSPATASKKIENAIKRNLIEEHDHPYDKRTKILKITQEFSKKIDIFLDNILDELRDTYVRIYEKDKENQ